MKILNNNLTTEAQRRRGHQNRIKKYLKLFSVSSVTLCLCGISFFSVLAVLPAEAKDINLGYVNIAKVFDEYEKTKESDKALEKKSQEKQLDRERYVTEIKKMKDEMELLNEKAKEERQKELDAKIDALQRFDKEARQDLMRERDMMAREILKDIDESVKDVGAKEGFTLVFDDRALLYSGQDIDITDKVLNTLNARYSKTRKAADDRR